MKIYTSYDLRGARITNTVSIPEPTIESLTKTIKHLAWVAGQVAPEVTIDESDV